MPEGTLILDRSTGVKTQISTLGDIPIPELEGLVKALDHIGEWQFFELGKFGLAFKRGRKIEDTGPNPRFLYVHFLEPLSELGYIPTEEEKEDILIRYVTSATREAVEEVPYPVFRLTQVYIYCSKYGIEELESLLLGLR